MFGNSDLFAFTRPDPTPEQIEIARSRGWFPVSRHENLDAHILSLFRVWLNVCAERDALGDDDEAAIIAVVTRMTAIENAIYSCRGGATGLAIKTFFSCKLDCNNWTPSAAQIRLEQDKSDDPGGWIESMLRDAASIVPEIGECAAAIVHEDAPLIDADLEVQWASWYLTEPKGPYETPEHRTEVRQKLQRALDCIADTPAKTPRGEAIKAKHAGATAPA